MPLANYPQGFSSGVQIKGLPVLNGYATSAGTLNVTNAGVWYVDSATGANGNKGDTWYQPLASLAGAISKAKAYDIVFIKQGHTETISAAVAMSVKGLQVFGMGVGNSRPTFTLDTANTNTFTVSVDSVGVDNCVFVANFLTIASCFTLTTAKNFTLTNCYFKDSSAALNWANIIKSTGAANTVDGLTAINNRVQSTGTTFNTFLLSANDIDQLTLQDNTVNAIATTNVASLGVITAGVVTGVKILNNTTSRVAATQSISLFNVGGTTSTGVIRNNFTQSADAATNVLVTTTNNFSFQGNSLSGAFGAQGFPIPALDS